MRHRPHRERDQYRSDDLPNGAWGFWSAGLDETSPSDERAERSTAVSAEENETVFRRWIKAYNDRDRQAEADDRAPGYVAHAPGVPEPLDSDAWAEFRVWVLATTARLGGLAGVSGGMEGSGQSSTRHE